MERVRILEHGRQKTAFTNQQKFLTLQSEAKVIFAKLKKPKKGQPHDFDSLKAGDAQVLVRYVYKADGREGISKQSATKQASVDYLNSLKTDELKTLLEAPPMLKDVPLLTAPIVATEEGTPDDQQPFHVTFGLVTASTGALVPIAAPEWLEESLNSQSDKRLNGKSILVNWGDASAPDWLVAKLGAKGDYELEGVKGNFMAKYVSDSSTAVHMLSIDDYAESVEDPTEHSWVLLGEKPLVAPPAAPPAAPQAMLQLMGPSSPVVEPTPAAAAAPRNAGQGKGKAGPSSTGTAGPSSAGMGRTGREPLPAAAAPDMSILATLDHRQLAELQVHIAQLLTTPAR
jgi:hypothetical protein